MYSFRWKTDTKDITVLCKQTSSFSKYLDKFHWPKMEKTDTSIQTVWINYLAVTIMCQSHRFSMISHWVHENILMSAFCWLAQRISIGFNLQALLVWHLYLAGTGSFLFFYTRGCMFEYSFWQNIFLFPWILWKRVENNSILTFKSQRTTRGPWKLYMLLNSKLGIDSRLRYTLVTCCYVKTLLKHRGMPHWTLAVLLASFTQLNCGQLQCIMQVNPVFPKSTESWENKKNPEAKYCPKWHLISCTSDFPVLHSTAVLVDHVLSVNDV